MLRLVTTADTEILATATAVRRLPDGFPEVRWANPSGIDDVDDILDGARVVVCRILGGRGGWPDGFDCLRARCAERSIALLALGGEAEPDAELTELSLAPAGAVAQAGEYLRHGDVDNVEQLLRFLADTFLLEGYGFDPPRPVPDLGIYERPQRPGRPTIGIAFYRSHMLTGNTEFIDALCEAVEGAGANAFPVWTYSLRPGPDGSVAALDLMRDRVDALLTTTLATGGSGAADEWDASALAALDVPVLQAVCATCSRAEWEASDTGLAPLDAATQVAIPEFDGRLLGGVVSFKERTDGVPRYVPDRERCGRVARLAVRHARLRSLARPRVAILLTSFPTRHARVGNAVGLDTPASAIELLAALGVDHGFADGDELMHALIAAGGHDPEFLTDAQLADAPLRLPVARYRGWYDELPAALRGSIERAWGAPPGDRYVDGEDFVVAGLDLGDVVVAIQPPRGHGDDPVRIYHDPELPPTHHYLASYWWLDRVWGADAIVHLGKHGTLEWLPGKTLALSAACAPDAVLGDVPLIYPFVVNDPGEGVQAKRRAHAVIVDHLVPPMMRAESYGELAELEALLDDYARLEVLDPGKLPALAARIWAAIEAANLQEEVGTGGDTAALVERLDGYLCEIKDIQVKDGLHVLGRPPESEQLRGLVAAMVPELRAEIAAAMPPRDDSAIAHRDRLAAAESAALEALAARVWSPGAAEEACELALGVAPPAVVERLRFAASEVVPRIRGARDEISSVLAALRGRHVLPGPSGSPTRGRLDVLPTGRNFYAVDPRAVPSQLSWEVGVRLADALLERHRADAGEWPRMVGLVAWGTAAMRTEGDDVAEILALLGVRPVWQPQTRRVTGVDVVPLEELGRPRIDVTVRISGFFRDAFPHLVTLLDDAVAAVAALDEPPELNFVAAHARADAERLAGSIDAWRQATARIFGSAPGTYGAGLLALLDARDWRDESDIARVYEAWGGYAYGRGLDGAALAGGMRDCFARIDVAVKNVDSHEQDILDSSEYAQYHGGMVAMVRALAGRDPAAYLGDSADPARVVTRTLVEETRRVFRARVANPRWIASMIRHGYKGASELAATVDYLFGYDATTGVVADWMYEQVAERYLLDPDVAAFMSRSNPWAARAIAERLLEASDRALWSARAETLDAIRGRYLELEGDLEEATA